MAEPIPYPERIEWDAAPIDGRTGKYFSGKPVGLHDLFDHEVLRAFEDCFEVSLGSFHLDGDAHGFEASKQAAEAAFCSLVELNNVLSKTDRADLTVLTSRELQIVESLRGGRRVVAIAKHLHISHHTVRNHLKQIYRKLRVGSQVELLAATRGGTRG